MDPISVTTGVIDLALKLKAVVDKINEVRHADDDMSKLGARISGVQDQLVWLQRHFRETAEGKMSTEYFLKLYRKETTWDGNKKKVMWDQGPVLKELTALLSGLQVKLHVDAVEAAKEKNAQPSPPAGSALKSKLRSFKKVFTRDTSARIVRGTKFVVHKADVKEDIATLEALMAEIERAKSSVTVDVVVGIDAKADTDRQKKDYKNILRWLSPLSFQDDQQNFEDIAIGTTIPSDWFFQKPVFEAWEEGRSWRLAVLGEAGSGKSVLASHIISYLKAKHARRSGTAVLFFYLDYRQHSAQDEQSLLASLLKQCVIHHGPENIDQELRKDFEEQHQQQASYASKAIIQKHLENELFKRLKRTYIIIDAMDQAKDDDTRKRLLNNLKVYMKRSYKSSDSGKVSLLSTSRRLEDKLFPDPLGCNECGRRDLDVYFTCKAHKIHEKEYHICPSCASSGKFCQVHPHELHAPYNKLTVNLTLPDGTIERYVEKQLSELLQLGNGSRDSTISAGSVSDYDDDEETTALIRMLRKDKVLSQTIISRISEQSNNLYQHAHLLWQHVSLSQREYDVQEALDNMPSELSEIVDNTMARVTSQDARNVILWACQAERPLSWQDIRFAASVNCKQPPGPGSEDEENDDDRLEEFHQGNLFDWASLKAGTRGLVFVSYNDTVRLAQGKVGEYLRGSAQKLFPDAQAYMAKVCLTTLLYSQLGKTVSDQNEAEEIEKRLQDYPFASYAAQYWGWHAQSCQLSPGVPQLLHKLFANEESLLSAVQISAYMEEKYKTGWEARKNVNALHVAAWFGLETTMKDLCSQYPIDGPDGTRFGRSPLIYACMGQERVNVASSGPWIAVQKLLDLGADPSKSDKRGTLPLFVAVMAGNAEVVKVLGKDARVDINAAPKYGRSALMMAAIRSRASVVEALLEHPDTNVNLHDDFGDTALTIAAGRDSPRGFKILLQAQGINIDEKGQGSATPLIWAAHHGKKWNVHWLLKAGADPNARDKDGGTALRRAIDNGHKSVVEEFQAEDRLHADDTEDSQGKDLLFSAAVNGHADIVQFLIDNGFDVNSRANDLSTPLHDAIDNNQSKPDTQLDVVKVLLRNGADATLTNQDGQTAADLARVRGDWDILDVLVPPTSPSAIAHDEESLPATSLARRGSDNVLLKKVTEPDFIRKRDASGQTPLAIAIHFKNVKSAQIILKAYADMKESIDVADIRNRTPLHEAADRGYTDLLRLMLAHDPKPNPNRVDSFGATPLSCAIRISDLDSTIALVEAGAIIDPQHLPPVPTLTQAIEDGNVDVAEKLIFAGVPIQPFEHVSLAKKTGNVEMMRLVNVHKTVVQRNGSQRDTQGDSQESKGPDLSKPKFKSREEPVGA